MTMKTGDTALDDRGGGIDADGGTWAVHFPGNLRWSNAMQIVKGMAPYGAIAMDEVDRIGRRLAARAGEADLDRVWREEWAAMADRVVAVADTAAAEQRHITAGNNYMRAGNYYYSAERFIPPGPEKWRCTIRRCAHIAPPWGACIPRSSASRFPTRTPACPPIS